VTTSPIFANAFALWRECRDAYELHLEAQLADAERECRGILLNRRGIAAGIAAESLFLGPAARANAYASDELLDYWATRPRITYAQFERQWWAS
jgi:hypothetical protein